jgi:hypothetical protein
MRHVILLICLLSIGSLSYLSGYINRSREVMASHDQCLNKQAFMPKSEICTYYGFRPECSGLKPRYTYTYASHKLYACLYGRVGKAWGGI